VLVYWRGAYCELLRETPVEELTLVSITPSRKLAHGWPVDELGLTGVFAVSLNLKLKLAADG
jgi:hypothetical protein